MAEATRPQLAHRSHSTAFSFAVTEGKPTALCAAAGARGIWGWACSISEKAAPSQPHQSLFPSAYPRFACSQLFWHRLTAVAEQIWEMQPWEWDAGGGNQQLPDWQQPQQPGGSPAVGRQILQDAGTELLGAFRPSYVEAPFLCRCGSAPQVVLKEPCACTDLLLRRVWSRRGPSGAGLSCGRRLKGPACRARLSSASCRPACTRESRKKQGASLVKRWSLLFPS